MSALKPLLASEVPSLCRVVLLPCLLALSFLAVATAALVLPVLCPSPVAAAVVPSDLMLF
jgi:hypothetical protein